MNHDRDTELDRALGALAREDQARALPEGVRRLAMAAWDTPGQRRVRPVASGRWMRAGAVAAMLCLAVAVSLRIRVSGTSPVTSRAQPAQRPAAGEALAPVATIRQPVDRAVTRPRAVAVTASAATSRRRAPAGQVGPREVARLQGGEQAATVIDDTAPIAENAPFVALEPGFDAQRLGWFQVARVQVPRRVLVDAGVLATEVGGFDLAQADVVFGEDGRARAIRLISTTRRTR